MVPQHFNHYLLAENILMTVDLYPNYRVNHVIGNWLKASIFVRVEVLWIAGRQQYHLPPPKSRLKICTFQPITVEYAVIYLLFNSFLTASPSFSLI